LSDPARILTYIAPRLLALFGERVTMQFMSQSTGWADNIIFAMAPLGIVTAIIGAIRVSGPSWLKTIIGRARESRAIAEAELMSSTSKEVCELWNGQEIVRVMGEGPIREFIILLPGPSGERRRMSQMESHWISGPKAGPLIDQETSVTKLSRLMDLSNGCLKRQSTYTHLGQLSYHLHNLTHLTRAYLSRVHVR
jgi:hypothetical protein